MKLKITSIEDKGILEKERIILRVLEDDDVGRYAIFKSRRLNETKVSNKIRETFWFPDQAVKKNDYVVVYTKIGSYISSKNSKGGDSHFFYWNKEAPVWTGDDDAVVLLNVAEWNYKFLNE